MTLQNSNVVLMACEDDKNRHVNGRKLSNDEFDALTNMNRLFAHSTAGTKNVIVSLRQNAVNNKEFSLEPFFEFRNRFLHEAKVAGLNKGDAWLRWSGKRYYPDGLGYYPNENLCPSTKFNMYLGFAVQPLEGDITPYLRHITNVICAGEKGPAHYLMQYLAHIVQEPQEKPSVAIVMKSTQGAGKGSMMKPIEQIFGNNYTQTNGAYLIAGRFNSAICNRLIVFADEVDLTNRKIADKFKALISESTVYLENKGMDPVAFPNYMRFIFASNHEQVLLAGNKERRYFVLEPSDQFAQDKNYFKNFYRWLDNNGAAYLLHYLLKLDISDFDPRRAPSTHALRDEITANLSTMESYMLHELCKVKPFGASKVSAEDVRIRLVDYLSSMSLPPQTEPQLRSKIGKIFKNFKITRTGKRGVNMLYHLPEAEEFRQKFKNKYGINPNDFI